MRRILLVLALAAAVLPATIQPASACSCIAVSPEELAKSAKVVFTGQARSVTDDGTFLIVRFRTRIVYKGAVPRHLDVITSNQSGVCGFPFHDGKRYTVFGGKIRGAETSTNLCTATKPGGIHPPKFDLPRGNRR